MLRVKRYVQHLSYCTVAAAASMANYYNRDIDYKTVKKLTDKYFNSNGEFNGLFTPEIGILLNALGFNKVVVVSSDLVYLDYAWAKKSKKFLVETFLSKSRKRKYEYKDECKRMYKFLINERKNKLIIDYNFIDYIKRSIDKGEPLIVTFNWTMFFKLKNENGEADEHAVVAKDYDKEGLIIVDSYGKTYRKKVRKYGDGVYRIEWEHLMSCMGTGDVIMASDYAGTNGELV